MLFFPFVLILVAVVIVLVHDLVLVLRVLDAVLFQCDRLVGLVVKASASRAEGPGFESRWRRDFFGVESYQ